MFSLVCPRPVVRTNFRQRRFSSATFLTAILIAAVTLATTACSTLSASGTPSIATVPIAMSANFPAAIVGTSYNSVISVNGGIAPYTFLIRTGTLPPGLKLSASTGSISGMPSTVGNYKFTVAVTDKNADAEGVKEIGRAHV